MAKRKVYKCFYFVEVLDNPDFGQQVFRYLSEKGRTEIEHKGKPSTADELLHNVLEINYGDIKFVLQKARRENIRVKFFWHFKGENEMTPFNPVRRMRGVAKAEKMALIAAKKKGKILRPVPKIKPRNKKTLNCP